MAQSVPGPSVFYRPADGVAADFIPFYWKGDYHLFYLKDYRDPSGRGEGTPWWHLVTRNFRDFEDWGEALPRGTREEQDLFVFTGCVLEAAGIFHIFYTGHNPDFRKAGKPEQAVLHATSTDLRRWDKDRDFCFVAPAEQGYEPHDWRDPFVYRDEPNGEYAMLLAARRTTGPSRNRGCTALATSRDLATWTVQAPLWAPDEYYTHECPDLFRSGDWWYLVYSTFSERCVTHYRISRTLSGPWLAPANDTFDGRAYYAAKTAGDGRRRFAFGWLPTRCEEKDDGGWQWGGDLVVHEIRPRRDGQLTVRMPKDVRSQFASPVELRPKTVFGDWKISGRRISSRSEGRFSLLMLGDLPDPGLVEMDLVSWKEGMSCGLVLRADEALERYYLLRFEPARQRMVVDRWPRPGDQPFMVERSLRIKAGRPVRVRVIVSGSCLVAYANDEVALSCRMYEHGTGQLGLFVAEGMASFGGLRMMSR